MGYLPDLASTTSASRFGFGPSPVGEVPSRVSRHRGSINQDSEKGGSGGGGNKSMVVSRSSQDAQGSP